MLRPTPTQLDCDRLARVLDGWVGHYENRSAAAWIAARVAEHVYDYGVEFSTSRNAYRLEMHDLVKSFADCDDDWRGDHE